MSEDSTISQLGGLALGNLLSEYGVDDEAARQHLGIQSTAFGANEIYEGKYMDDEDQFRGMEGDAEEDDEDEEDDQANGMGNAGGMEMDRYLREGLAAISSSSSSFSKNIQSANANRNDILLPGGVRIKKEIDDDEDDDDQEGDEPEQQGQGQGQGQGQEERIQEQRPKTVEEIWKGFKRGETLDFIKLYWPESMARPLKKRKLGLVNHVPELRTSNLPSPPSTRQDQLNPAPSRISNRDHLRQIIAPLLPDLTNTSRKSRFFDIDENEEMETIGIGAFGKGDGRGKGKGKSKTGGNPNLELEEWEGKIIWGPEKDPLPLPSSDHRIQRLSNPTLSNGDFLDSIIWSSDSDFKRFDELILDLNDPGMILDVLEAGGEGEAGQSSTASNNSQALSKRSRPVAELDPFNLSADHHYEISKEHRQRVRQTLGNLEIQHSWPAQKLQLPFYKPRLTKAEARSFHRPAMQFPSNIPLRFSRVEKSSSSKNKKDRKNPEEALRSVRDLTLKDTSGFVLYEFSEEYPPILSKIGMGSLIVNYYRKKDPKDEYIPKSDLGEAFVLEENDESPFMKFGFVDPGETQPTLYTNLIRAPIFRHRPNHTDYLLIRSTTKNSVRYYLREVKTTFTVGQTYPTTPIPGPHARLVTNAIKNRLYMIVHKLIRSSKGERIKIHRIMRYFADQSELQMRARLKEFMEYRRLSGDPDQGFWKMKPGAHIPDPVQLRSLLPPEHLCLSEAMQAGQRRLLDAGYSRTAEGADEEGDELNGNLDIEQLLAPWIATKNFIHASQGKAMLKLHGDGDPTGMGEGFSFLRVSMKETFLRAGETLKDREAAEEATLKSSGHRYNTSEQQNIYKSEIERIWKAQHRSLSNPIPPELTVEDERRAERAAHQLEQNSRQRSISRAPSVSGRENSPGAKGADKDGERESGKVLKIRRLINGKWKSELVRDPGVIASYIRHRQKLQASSGSAEDLKPTGDATMDALAKERLAQEIAAATRNQERRQQRRRQKAAAEGRLVGEKPLKSETTRKCGRCQQVGHMSTNTSCPLYDPEAARQKKQQVAQKTAPSSSSSTAQPTPGSSRPSLSMGGGFFGGAPMQSPMSAGPMPPFTSMGPVPGAEMMQPPATPSASSPPPVPQSASSPPTNPQSQPPKLKIKLKPSSNQ